MARSTPAFRYALNLQKGRWRTPLAITIWQAMPVKEGDWSCYVTLKGLKSVEGHFECAGIDALQAHILALVYLRAAFKCLAKEGFHYLDPISNERIDPEWYFPSLETKTKSPRRRTT